MMGQVRTWHARRSSRLVGYDHSQPGLSIVTVCTWHRAPLLGEIVGCEMRLSPAGRVTLDAWESLPVWFPALALDAFGVMPSHVHGIPMLGSDPDLPPDIAEPTLGAVVRAFTSISGVEGNRSWGVRGSVSGSEAITTATSAAPTNWP